MEPTATDVTNAIASLLQSGGSAATVVIVWIALRLKSAVESYLDGLREAMDKYTNVISQVSITLGQLQQTLDRFPPPPKPPTLPSRSPEP